MDQFSIQFCLLSVCVKEVAESEKFSKPPPIEKFSKAHEAKN